ncbi:MAG: ShlB/FhaC/HecB family hemolysin secretion/activation protein [Thermaurantiacus sp.]
MSAISPATWAQDFRQSVPRVPDVVPPTVADPDIPLPEAEDPTPIIPRLVAVRFVADLADLAAADAIGAEGVIIVALPVLDTADFRARAAADLNQPASLASLNALARATVEAYRAEGRPLVDVAIPEQDVTDGQVTFLVREFVVGDVAIEGNRHFSTDRLRRMVRLEPGQNVDQNALVSDLDWMAQNPFRRVDLFYRRGDAPLTTDVVIRVTDRLPLRVYAAFENNGSVRTGRERWSAGVNWGRFFGGDGQFAYQFTSSGDIFQDRAGLPLQFEAHSFTLAQPLGRRNSLIVFGTYQRTSPDLGPFLGLVGKSYQLSPRFVIPVFARAGARGQLTIGYDYKETDNNLLFGGISIAPEATQIHQAVVDFTATTSWAGGIFSSSNTLHLSPGGIGSRNTDAAFQPGPGQSGTPFAKASYVYLRSTLTQRTPLGATGAELVTRLVGQVSSANLLPSEQLSAAGPGFVRAYDPNAVIGTRGVLFSQEFWSPPFAIFGGPRLDDRMQLGGFIDAGAVGNPDRLPDERKWRRTASVGAMGRYRVGPWLDIRLDYGTQLRRQPGLASRENLGFLSVTLGY